MRLGIYSLLLLVSLPGLSKHALSWAAADPAASQPIDQTTDRTATDHPTTSAVPDTLFAQSAVQALARDFSGRDSSCLLLAARSGALLASRWEKSSQPIPLGSLVKPFSALACAETHDFQYPSLECTGQASGCWQMHPHGRLNIVSASSVSCNSYFRSLAESVAPEQLFAVTQAFDLESPDSRFTAATLVGLGERWKISPLRMARAYLELLRRRDHPGVHELLAGMQQSAQAAADVYAFDALIQNPDRRYDNPNLFIASDEIYVYDHETSFSFLQAIFPSQQRWNLHSEIYLRNHIFYAGLKGKSIELQRFGQRLSDLSDSVLDGLRDEIPEEWMHGCLTSIENHLRTIRSHAAEVNEQVQRSLVRKNHIRTASYGTCMIPSPRNSLTSVLWCIPKK